MASNPMQRKARISFLIGMLVTLMITGTIIALLLMTLTTQKKKQEEEKNKDPLTMVYVLTTNVKSGQTLTEDMYSQKTVVTSMVPANAASAAKDTLDEYKLQDKAGNSVSTQKITRNSSTGEMLIDSDKGEDVTILNLPEGKKELLIEEQTKEYYYFNDERSYLDVEKNKNDPSLKTYVSMNESPLIAKVNMRANTVLTEDLVAKGTDSVSNDAREQEYNMVTLPSGLTTGDFIDIRFMLPSGEDFIVVSKKEVTIPEAAGVPMSDVIKLVMNEVETMTMSSAIVDNYKIEGSKLYAIKYTEAGIQDAATGTYYPSGATIDLVKNDPNVVAKAREELVKRSNHNASGLRENYINGAIINAGEEAGDRVKEKMEESITKSQESRKSYLEGI